MLRCAIVPPVPVPYREPLFRRLDERPDVDLQVIYQAASQPSWNQAADWFPSNHGYDAAHLRGSQLARAGRSPISWPRGLERALSSFDADVVVVSEFGPATLRALRWCRKRDRALAILTEVTAAVERTLSPPQRRLHRWVVRQADGLIPVGSAAAERLLALGADPDRVLVSLQPVDEEALREAVASHPRRQEGPVEILAVARLVEDKGVASLLDAFAAAELDEREATLTVVGGGPLEAELRRRAEALAVPAQLAGAVGASDLPGRYAQAGVFALPSLYEPFGVALREAVVAGLPVICSTAVGAAADFAHAEANAILVEPGDVRALADALRRLCRDRDLRQRMGDESRSIAELHPLQADVDSFATAIGRAARRTRRLSPAA